MYRLVPFFHLTQSNIDVMWLPIEFKDNTSRMPCEISTYVVIYTENVVILDDKLYTPK